MPLKIRFDEGERVLRSVDETPGILGLAIPEGRPTFVVDPGIQPGEKPPDGTLKVTWDELREAVPPAYTAHIGSYLLTHLEAAQKAAA